MTEDDVRREIADALMRRDREAREKRRERDAKADRFRKTLFAHVFCGAAAFAACWLVCGVLLAAFSAGPPGPGAFFFVSFAPFALWLAGAAIYARRTFGPGREGDGGDR